MQQNSGKVARNIASGNKIKNKVFNFVTEYFLVLGYAPVVYFFGLWSNFVLSDYNQCGPKTKTEKVLLSKNNIFRELARFFRCSGFVLPQSVQRPKRKKGIYCHQNQTFKSISVCPHIWQYPPPPPGVCRCSGVLMSFVQYLKIEEENRFSPASAILENEKNLGTWLQET